MRSGRWPQAQLLENVDGHDKNFGFHSFGLGGP